MFSQCFPFSREWVHIEVRDVNEFPPVFTQETYSIEVKEGTINDNLLTLETTDQDTSELYHRVCKYIMISTDIPFAISDSGKA